MKLNRYLSFTILALALFLLLLIPTATPEILILFLATMIFSRTDERLPFLLSSIMIIAGVGLLIFSKTQLANQYGNYAFYFFIIGTVVSLISTYCSKK